MIRARDDASSAQALATIAEPVLRAVTRAQVVRSLAEAGAHGAALAQAGAAALQAFVGLTDAWLRMAACLAKDAAGDSSFRSEMAPLGMQRAAEAFALALHHVQQPWQVLLDSALGEAECPDGGARVTFEAADQIAAVGAALTMFADPDTLAALPAAGIPGARLLAAIGTLTEAADRHAAALRGARDGRTLRRRLGRIIADLAAGASAEAGHP